MACADTSFLLDLAGRGGRKRRRGARDKLVDLTGGGECVVTTRFTVAELWVGVFRSQVPGSEQAAVEAILKPLPILEFDEPAARLFGRVSATLQARGTPVGDMDVLIGSVCLANGHSIITRNPRHFQRIPGLQVETY